MHSFTTVLFCLLLIPVGIMCASWVNNHWLTTPAVALPLPEAQPLVITPLNKPAEPAVQPYFTVCNHFSTPLKLASGEWNLHPGYRLACVRPNSGEFLLCPVSGVIVPSKLAPHCHAIAFELQGGNFVGTCPLTGQRVIWVKLNVIRKPGDQVAWERTTPYMLAILPKSTPTTETS